MNRFNFAMQVHQELQAGSWPQCAPKLASGLPMNLDRREKRKNKKRLPFPLFFSANKDQFLGREQVRKEHEAPLAAKIWLSFGAPPTKDAGTKLLFLSYEKRCLITR